ncbi:phage tail protein [Lutibacter flavus]|uniref:Phage Tail Collar Domain n=1 Tax=Lutibacter flavus TaxID=691689 RepID=A0A238YKU3_9FLAO|nr:phage tail protein [Lutibacter flavus]SNR71622.1 Phage Tail Collar Domain [Lutibacter flavus]
MKSKLLLLSFLMLFTFTTNYAQSSAETSGIAIQGIARDINNTARANEDINLTFSIYYKVLEVAQPPIVNYTEPLTTDAFGVFSHVINNPYTNNNLFEKYQMWLKIDEGGTIISDEKLKHVPYAISANNGVPVGSIMPFVGTVAPAGWALCNGQDLTAIDGSEALIDLLVNDYAPNLGGMFLRGTGGSGDHVGPALNTTQDDTAGPHTHPNDIVITGGEADAEAQGQFTLPTGSPGIFNNGRGFFFTDILNGETATIGINSDVRVYEHETTKTGGVQTNTGVVETRPVSYGVNYIIKL